MSTAVLDEVTIENHDCGAAVEVTSRTLSCDGVEIVREVCGVCGLVWRGRREESRGRWSFKVVGYEEQER